VRVARSGELPGDLKAGVAAAHHQHLPAGHVSRPAVVGAVELRHVAGELLRDGRDARDLERSGRDHDLVAVQRPVGQLDAVAAVVWVKAGDAAGDLDGQREVTRVAGEVADNLVARRVVVGLAGKRAPGRELYRRGVKSRSESTATARRPRAPRRRRGS
jgi:hypothetical protein